MITLVMKSFTLTGQSETKVPSITIKGKYMRVTWCTHFGVHECHPFCHFLSGGNREIGVHVVDYRQYGSHARIQAYRVHFCEGRRKLLLHPNIESLLICLMPLFIVLLLIN